MNVICIKLSNGDELIGRNVERLEVTDALCIKDVFSIGLQQVSPREVAVGMMPWLVGNPGAEVPINFSHIVTTYEPAGELRDKYIQQTTGIQLAR